MKNRLILYLIPLCILLAACKAYEYTAPAHIVPLHQKKGELKTSVSLLGIQNSYSFSDRLFLFQTLHYRRSFEEDKHGEATYEDKKEDSYSLEIGSGYYKAKKHLIFECMVGAGYCDFNYDFYDHMGYTYYAYTINSDRWNAFIQPNLGFRLNEFIELAFFSKVNYLNYSDLQVSWNVDQRVFEEPYRLDSPTFETVKSRDFLFIEPGIIYRFGLEKIKVHCLISKTYQLSKSPIIYRDWNVQVGVFLNLNILGNKN